MHSLESATGLGLIYTSGFKKKNKKIKKPHNSASLKIFWLKKKKKKPEKKQTLTKGIKFPKVNNYYTPSKSFSSMADKLKHAIISATLQNSSHTERLPTPSVSSTLTVNNNPTHVQLV